MVKNIEDDNQVDKVPNIPAKQQVSGVILIDKPQGLTSQQVVSKVKYLFKSPLHNSKKAGHTGTLDPMATGLLPICLGEATKFSHYQLDADKTYIATVQLGAQTDTGDAEGQQIAQQDVPTLSIEQLQTVTAQFMGEQTQIPPMYSALKKDGKKLYEYARAGIEVERPARTINIKAISCNLLTEESLQLTVTCSKGTYIRVLGEDIAKALGTLGYLTALRRTDVGQFFIKNAISLSDLEALDLKQRFGSMVDIDACIMNVPQLQLDDGLCARLRLGQRINVYTLLTDDLQQYLLTSSGLTDNIDQNIKADIRIINNAGQFMGLGALQPNGRLQPKKMINI